MKTVKNYTFHGLKKTAEDTDRVGSMYCVISVILDIFAGGGCRIDDFNFKGRTKQFSEEIKRIKPTDECMSYIEKKMIAGFDFVYDFNDWEE